MENKVPYQEEGRSGYNSGEKTPFSLGPPWSGCNIPLCPSTKTHRSDRSDECQARFVNEECRNGTLLPERYLRLYGRNRLADVTEKGAWQRRQAPLNMKDDAEDTDEALPDAHFQKLTSIGHHGRSENKGLRHFDEPFTESDIFENRLIGKSAEAFEQCAADEEGLVAINDAASDTADVVQERDQFQPPVVAGELVHESSSLNTLIGFHLVQPQDCLRRQDRISMEKKQPVAARFLCSGIHLTCAAS